MFSEAFGINRAGQIVGVATVAGLPYLNEDWNAFLFRNGKMQAIGGTASNRFLAYAISDNGWITGTLFNSPIRLVVPNGSPGEQAPNTGYAALYVNGRLTSLGTLIGFTGSQGVSINNSGTVVGDLTGVNSGAFVYSGGKMYDLNNLIRRDIVTEVGDINDAGQIAATGVKPGSKATYAIVVTEVGDINDAGQIAATGVKPGSKATYAILLDPIR